MLRLTCKILISNFEFDYVNALEIVSTWNDFTSTAMIKLPKKLEFDGKPIIAGSDPLFKRGDAVEIWLGYDEDLRLEFSGFVSDVIPALPMVIKCEDQMWQLKQSNFNASYRSVNLQDLIKDVVDNAGSDIEINANDINLGKFRATNANSAEVFDELKKTYGIITFIQNGVLYSGLPYREELQEEETYKLEQNVIDDSDLIYSRADDKKIKIKAVSIYPDNTKEEAEAGDSTGEQRTLNFYDIPKSELKETAERELSRLKIDGYTGSLKGFGLPFVQHNDAVTIKSEATPEREGTYLVKGTVVNFGVNGFRRKVILDKKI